MAEYKVLTAQEKTRLVLQAGIQKVYELCLEAKPGHKFALVGDKINCNCIFPGHSDENPSCDIVFRDGRIWAKCMACKQFTSNVFHLLRLLTGITDQQRILAEIISQRFGVSLPESVEDALAMEVELQNIKEGLLTAANQVLILAASTADPEYEYARAAVALLRKRGIDTNLLPAMRLGAFPTKEHLHRFAPDVMGPARDYLGPKVIEEKPKAIGNYGGWVLFPYFTTTTSIGRLKLRNPLVKSESRYLGKHRKEPRGFFGLHMFASAIGGEDEASRTAYLVEGEFDQLSMYQEQQRVNANQLHIVLGASGTGSSDLDLLADSAIHQAVIIGDNDTAGEGFKKNILRHTSQKRVRHVNIHEWPAALAAYDDPDDVVVKGDYQTLIDGLTQRTDVVELSEWCARRVDAEVSLLDVPRTLTKIDIANEYGKLIGDEVERDLFVSRAADALDIDSALLAKHVVVDDTEEGFRMNVERCLSQYALPVATLSYDKALLYSRTNKDLFEVSLKKPRDVELSFQTQVFHMKAFNFIQAKIGIPDWISMDLGKKVPTPRSSMAQARTLQNHFDWAVQNFVAAAGPLSQFSVRRQGIHWADAREDEHDRELLSKYTPDERLYVVNGNSLIRLTPDEGRQAVAEEMQTPLDGIYLFWGDRGRKWCHARNVDELMRTPPYTPRECYDMLFNMLNEAWEFRHQKLAAQFLAAQMLTINVSMIFDYLPYVFFTAPTQSGKSTLLKGLLGGHDPKNIGVLEQVACYDDYSAAGIMQNADASTIIHCLDEWEDPDTAKGSHKGGVVSTLLEMTRNLSAGMTRTRGTKSGKAMETYLRFVIFAAGIVPHQQAVDLNRWFTIELAKREGTVAPEVTIGNMYSREELTNLKHSLTLNAIQNAFVLKDIEGALYKDILDDHKIEVKQTRFAKAMISAVAGLRWAGVPGDMKFAQDWLRLNEEYVSQTDVSEEKKLFRAVFETNAVKLGHDTVLRSVTHYLSDLESRDHLSAANCGVYYMPGTDVVVLYPGKLREVLRYNADYRSTTNQHQIFSLLKRVPEVHHDPKFFMANAAIFMHLRKYLSSPRPEELLYIKLNDLSFNHPNPVHYGPPADGDIE
jgi:hypothetical protein